MFRATAIFFLTSENELPYWRHSIWGFHVSMLAVTLASSWRHLKCQYSQSLFYALVALMKKWA